MASDRHTLTKIRDAIVTYPQRWQHVISSKAFCATGSLGGDLLQCHPSGYDPEPLLLADRRRKDDMALAHFTEAQTCALDFLHAFIEPCRTFALLTHCLMTVLELAWEGEGESRGVGIMPHTGPAQRRQRLLH
jgi:hypothetical protein